VNEAEEFLDTSPSSDATFHERVELVARALAYGVSIDRWTPKIKVQRPYPKEVWISVGLPQHSEALTAYLSMIWGNQQPQMSFLEAFGYVKEIGKKDRKIGVSQHATDIEYLLTPKALALLEKPSAPPSVFISYRRSESSALGLLIVARLQAKGIPNPFIDMNIAPGDIWHAQLEKIIKNSKYFISLLGKEPFSEMVEKEIKWASEVPNLIYIPIWHNGYKPEQVNSLQSDVREFVTNANAIRVKEESAEEYNNAMVQLLNRLGYAP
jgi:hypothetical protein